MIVLYILQILLIDGVEIHVIQLLIYMEIMILKLVKQIVLISNLLLMLNILIDFV